MESLRELGDSHAFADGLLLGCFVVLTSAVLALADRRSRRSSIVGYGIAAATLAAIVRTFGHDAVPLGVMIALGALALGGLAAKRFNLPPRRTLLLLVPGGFLLAVAAPDLVIGTNLIEVPIAVRVVAGLAAPVVGLAIADFDRVHVESGLVIPMLVLASAGLFIAAPDTELSAALLGVCLPTLACVVPKPLGRIDGGGAAALAGCFCWIAAVASEAAPGALVGALGGLGRLVAEPLARRIPEPLVTQRQRQLEGRRRGKPKERRFIVLLTALAAQIVMVLYASRVVAAEDSMLMATLVLLPGLATLVLVSRELVPRSRRRRRRRSGGSGRSRRPGEPGSGASATSGSGRQRSDWSRPGRNAQRGAVR